MSDFTKYNVKKGRDLTKDTIKKALDVFDGDVHEDTETYEGKTVTVYVSENIPFEGYQSVKVAKLNDETALIEFTNEPLSNVSGPEALEKTNKRKNELLQKVTGKSMEELKEDLK